MSVRHLPGRARPERGRPMEEREERLRPRSHGDGVGRERQQQVVRQDHSSESVLLLRMYTFVS